MLIEDRYIYNEIIRSIKFWEERVKEMDDPDYKMILESGREIEFDENQRRILKEGYTAKVEAYKHIKCEVEHWRDHEMKAMAEDERIRNDYNKSLKSA